MKRFFIILAGALACAALIYFVIRYETVNSAVLEKETEDEEIFLSEEDRDEARLYWDGIIDRYGNVVRDFSAALRNVDKKDKEALESMKPMLNDAFFLRKKIELDVAGFSVEQRKKFEAVNDRLDDLEYKYECAVNYEPKFYYSSNDTANGEVWEIVIE